VKRDIWRGVRVETQDMGIGIKRTGGKVQRNAQVIRKSRPRREQEEREREVAVAFNKLVLGGQRRTAEVVEVDFSWPTFEEWAYRVEQEERRKYGINRLIFAPQERAVVELPPVSVRDFLLSARVENPYRDDVPVGNYCTSQVENLQYSDEFFGGFHASTR
jgi:hypothetical protein